MPDSAQGPLDSLTNNQKVLSFYYSLRACGIKPRLTVDLAPIARLMHLVLGKAYTTIDRSDLYRKLQNVPNFNTPKGLARDLACIKPFFLRVEFQQALQLIEQDLEILQRPLQYK